MRSYSSAVSPSADHGWTWSGVRAAFWTVSTTSLTVPGSYPQEPAPTSPELGNVCALTGGLVRMGHRLAARGLVVGSCLLALLGTACSPTDPPAPTPSSNVPSASPTPTENAQEREERLAYAAAETSYREFRAEFREVTGAGGASKPSSIMKQTASGPYLADATKVIMAYKETGGYTTGTTRIGYIRGAGYSTSSLILDVCEDETSVKTFNSERKQVARNGVLVLRLDVRKIEGSWKVWDFTGQKEKGCA